MASVEIALVGGTQQMKKLVVASGGFDPLHKGHINLFRAAKALGDTLIVIVESDEYVEQKHPVLISQMDRVAIIREISCVDIVLPNDQKNGDDSGILSTLRPNIYAVGPDHCDVTTLPEWKMCSNLGISVVSLNGLEKTPTTSSSTLVTRLSLKQQWINPPVGVGAIIVNGGRVLAGIRKKEDRKGMLEVPGGFLEVDESLEDCLKREVYEEVNASTCDLAYFTSIPTRYTDGREMLAVYFRCRIKEQPTESSEMGCLRWLDMVPNESGWAQECDFKAVSFWFEDYR
jgi:cytidyltransferase-like protein